MINQNQFTPNSLHTASLIDDRVEKNLMKRLFERKSGALQELNREMLAEAVEMESLLARLRNLGGEDEDDAVSGIEAGSGSDEEEDEEDGRREERAQVQKSVRMCESSIDRISRELDLYNTDLDDLTEVNPNPNPSEGHICHFLLCKSE